MKIRAVVAGFLAASMTVVIIRILNAYVLKMTIPDLIAGWLGACAYFGAYEITKNWDK
jgi:hypothetical protein